MVQNAGQAKGLSANMTVLTAGEVPRLPTMKAWSKGFERKSVGGATFTFQWKEDYSASSTLGVWKVLLCSLSLIAFIFSSSLQALEILRWEEGGRGERRKRRKRN